jgi:RNA polymerase sigma factor (sigma-70 family)
VCGQCDDTTSPNLKEVRTMTMLDNPTGGGNVGSHWSRSFTVPLPPTVRQRVNEPSPWTDASARRAEEGWALVRRAQAGGEDGRAAFAELFARNVDSIYRFIVVRVRAKQVAEDLTQETFVRALGRINAFTWQGHDIGAWLVTIARNLIADHFKSARVRLEVSTGDLVDIDRDERTAEGRPEAQVVEHQTNLDLLGAVNRLSASQRECIVLRFLRGLSVVETAHAMGKNYNAIKALQYRAVRSLYQLLPPGFEDSYRGAETWLEPEPTDGARRRSSHCSSRTHARLGTCAQSHRGASGRRPMPSAVTPATPEPPVGGSANDAQCRATGRRGRPVAGR